MRTFLLRNKKPIVKWGAIKKDTFFKGEIPEGYNLAVNPSKGVVIIDVDIDKKEGKDGFKYMPTEIKGELLKTLNYKTKRGGSHFWVKYTGDEKLINKSTEYGIDLRTEKGYAVWYPERRFKKKILSEINESSEELNIWLESLFTIHR